VSDRDFLHLVFLGCHEATSIFDHHQTFLAHRTKPSMSPK